MVRRGGLSVLVAARDQRSGHRVALKVVAIDPFDSGIRHRIAREVAILQQLEHPRIVRCVDAGDLSAMQVYLALEWLEGQDLAQLMGRGPLTLRTSLEVVAQVGDALDAAHRQKIIHRDIKPANIFVMGRPGRLDCRVLDFGVAKMGAGAGTITQTGAILGTPNYMAPEQASTAMSVDGRADLYSLGVVAFELITRRLPFTANTDLARLARILVEEATPIRKVVPDLPPSAAELIDGLLVREPEGRIATAEAARALALGTLEALPVQMLDRVYAAKDVRDPFEDEAEESEPAGTVPLVRAYQSTGNHLNEATPLDMFAPPDRSNGVEGQRARTRSRPGSTADGEEWIGTMPSLGATVIDPVAAWATVGVDPGERPATASWDRRTTTDFEVTGSFFGREEQIDRVMTRLHGAISGAQPTLQLLVGPGGIGKTRLRAELVSRLAQWSHPPRVFAARAEERRQRVPFGFVRQLLFALADVSGGDPPRVQAARVLSLLRSPRDVQRLLSETRPILGGPARDADAAELERALVAAFAAEALGLNYPEVPQVVAARASPARAGLLMIEALDVILRGRAEDGGLVVIVDDMHWLDLGSARVLRALLMAGRTLPAAVVGFGSPTLLDPDAQDEWPLADLGATVEAAARLGRLPPPAARAFVESLLPAAAPERDVERVVQKAAGNVLYLEQLTLATAETGHWRAESGRMRWVGSSEPLFPTVAAAVSARLGQRSAAAQRVITAAAVFGTVFWAEGVAALTQIDLRQVEAELEALVFQRWFRPRRPGRYAGQTEYEFVHGALQAVALARLKRKRREAFEAKAASYLVSVGEREPSVLALHRAASGQPAAQTYLAAAERALRFGDPDTAAKLAEDGLGLPESQRGPLDEALRAIQEAVAFATADWALGIEAQDALAETVTTPTGRAELACRRCRLALLTGELEAAGEASEAASAEVGLSASYAAFVELHRAEVAERFGELREAGQRFAEAHRGLEGASNWADGLARATAGLARSALTSAEYTTAENRFRAVLVHARSRHRADALVEAHWGLVEVSRQLGDLRRARVFAAEMERADLSADRPARARLIRGLLAAESGRWAEAQTHLERAVDDALGPDERLWIRSLVALAHLFRLPNDLTPGLSRSRQRTGRLLDGLESAVEAAAATWPAWTGVVMLARATVAASMRASEPVSTERAIRGFEANGVMVGDEPASAAFGLARLWMVNEAYSEPGRTYLRRAVRSLDTVIARLGPDERHRYLIRPSIAAIVEEARIAQVATGPDPHSRRLKIL